MSNKAQWLIDYDRTRELTFTADADEGKLYTQAGALCGSGEIPYGPAIRDIDISEEGASGEVAQGTVHVGFAAAAVVAGNFVMPAASGTLTPVTADKDYYVGIAIDAQSTVGGEFRYIWQPGFYAV